MAVIRCEMCGGSIKLLPGTRFVRCEYCGSIQTISEQKTGAEPKGRPEKSDGALHISQSYYDGVRIDAPVPVGGRIVRITQAFAESPGVRYYLCSPENGETALLSVAATKELNGQLEYAETILSHLAGRAAFYEKENAARGGRPVNYDLLFPGVLYAGVSEEQGGRCVQLLSLRGQELFPASLLAQKRQRVDLKTSGWIMGRLLKLLGFAHENGVTVPVSADGVLISSGRHALMIYDWVDAKRWPDGTPAEAACDAIAAAAELCLALVDARAGRTAEYPYPFENGAKEKDYLALLNDMRLHRYDDAFAAHRDFYALMEQIWGIQFHPFSTYNKMEV